MTMEKFVDITITGDRQLQRKLKALVLKVQRKIVRRAGRKAMKIVQAEAKALAPKDIGALSKSIVVRSGKAKRRGDIRIIVRTATRDELAKKIKNKTKAARHISDEGYYPAAQEYGTRNMPAHPYLRPALDNKRAQAQNVFAAEIADGIAKAVR